MYHVFPPCTFGAPSFQFPLQLIDQCNININCCETCFRVLTYRGNYTHHYYVLKCIFLELLFLTEYSRYLCGYQRHIDDLVQGCSIAIASTLEILQSCPKPSISVWKWHTGNNELLWFIAMAKVMAKYQTSMFHCPRWDLFYYEGLP